MVLFNVLSSRSALSTVRELQKKPNKNMLKEASDAINEASSSKYENKTKLRSRQVQIRVRAGRSEKASRSRKEKKTNHLHR